MFVFYLQLECGKLDIAIYANLASHQGERFLLKRRENWQLCIKMYSEEAKDGVRFCVQSREKP